MDKWYSTRAQARLFMEPIGDPFGGAAYGEKNDPGQIIGAGASIVGGLMGADASSSAADAQAQSAREANATQLAMFNQTRADQEPWRLAGTAGVNRLAQLLGLDVPASTANSPDAAAIRTRLTPQYTSQTGQMTPRYVASGDDNNTPMLVGFDQSPAVIDQAGLSQAVQRELQQQSGAATHPSDFGSLMKPFGMSDYQADPGYGFRLSEGMKALERSAAARGQLLSGSVLKGITRFSQDTASNEYSNAYNRYNQNQSNQFNRLAAISGIGQTSAQQIGSLGTQTAQGIAANQVGIGNARASGYVGSSNALSGGLSGAYNNYSQNELLKYLRDKNAPLIQDTIPGQYSLGNPQYG